MVLLGDKECDRETAYYLKFGRILPITGKGKPKPPTEFDWEQINEPDHYYCWQGTKMPQWFE